MRNHRLLIGFVVLVALVATGLLFRNAIVSFAAARVMAGLGVSCDPVRASVRLSPYLSPIELWPTRCDIGDGPVESIYFHTPVYIDVEGPRVALVQCASVTIALRVLRNREVELHTLGDLSSLVGLDKAVLDLIFDASRFSLRKVPPFFASRAQVLRAGEPIAQLREVEIVGKSTGLSVSARSMHFDSVPVSGDIALKMNATADRASAEVRFQEGRHATVTAERMREDRPVVQFEIDELPP